MNHVGEREGRGGAGRAGAIASQHLLASGSEAVGLPDAASRLSLPWCSVPGVLG